MVVDGIAYCCNDFSCVLRAWFSVDVFHIFVYGCWREFYVLCRCVSGPVFYRYILMSREWGITPTLACVKLLRKKKERKR